MKQSKKIQKRSPPGKKNIAGSASVADSGTQGRSKAETAPQNGHKPYQFQPGNPYAWKPGVSGNPAGRPPGGVKQITQGIGEQFNRKTGKTKDEHLFEFLYRRGCQGNLKAAELWLNYRWGRPTQILEHSGGINLADMMEKMRKGRERVRAAGAELPEGTPTDGSGEAERALAATATVEQEG